MHKTSLVKVVGLFLVLSLYIDAGIANSDDGHDIEKHYVFLEKLAERSTPDQITGLQRYIEGNPDFQPAFSLLLDLYLSEGQLRNAKSYFTKLSEDAEHFNNSQWMLAKIFTLEGSFIPAYQAYGKSLNENRFETSTLIIRDLVDFSFQFKEQLKGIDDLLELSHLQEIFNSSLIYIKKSNAKKALEGFNSLYEKYPDNVLLIHYMAVCHYDLGATTIADSIWHDGIKLCKKIGDLRSEALFKANLGVLEYRRSNFEASLSYLDSAFSIAKRIKDLHRMQFALGNKGNVLRKRNEYTKAIRQLNLAINGALKINRHSDASLWYIYKGEALFQLRNYRDALLSYEQGELNALKAKDNKKQTTLKLTIGNLFSFLYLNDLAKYNYQQAYKLADQNNFNREKQRALAGLAWVMRREGDYKGARKTYLEIIDLSTRPINSVFRKWQLADTYYEEGLLDQAFEAYDHAFKTAEVVRSKYWSEYYMTWSLLRIAAIEALKENYDKAIQTYNEDVVLSIAAKDKRTFIEKQLGLGKAYQKKGELEDAISAFKVAVDSIETGRDDLKVEQFRIGFFSEVYKAYRHLAECYLERYEQNGEPGDLDSLYTFEKLSRARALLDLTSHKTFSGKSTVSDSGYQEYLQSGRELQKLQRQFRQSPASFDSLKIQHETLRFSLIEKQLKLVESVIADSLSEGSQVDSLSDLIEILKTQNLGLLQYHISEETSFVLVVSGDSATVVKLNLSQDSLASAIDSLIAPFHNVNEDSILSTAFRAEIANKLFKLLVEPVQKAVRLPGNLIVVPDLALMKLPFEMLLVERQDVPEFTPQDFPSYKKDFLGLRYSFVYSPSPAFLGQENKRSRSSPNVLVFANPFPDSAKSDGRDKLRTAIGWRFDPLRYARKEAVEIKDIYSKTQIFEGEDATEKNLIEQAPKSQVLHFATHAFADLTFVDFSGLVLAAGKDSTDDGILMGYQVPDLNLNCDLVTLSACETGRGTVVAGEGILALPRQFLAAGAKSVLMTHWKVDDKFASELMPKFYGKYLGEGLSKTEALNFVKNKTLESATKGKNVYYQHPFFWASFVLYGEPGNARQTFDKWLIFILIFILITVVIFIKMRYEKR